MKRWKLKPYRLNAISLIRLNDSEFIVEIKIPILFGVFQARNENVHNHYQLKNGNGDILIDSKWPFSEDE